MYGSPSVSIKSTLLIDLTLYNYKKKLMVFRGLKRFRGAYPRVRTILKVFIDF